MSTSLELGRRARDWGMASAEAHRGAEQDRLVIDNVIEYLAGTMDAFSANDVRELLPAVAGQLIGSRFLTASKRGLIERVGDTQATHEEGHARRISVWRNAAGADWPSRPKATSKQVAYQPAPEPAGPPVQTSLF